MAMWVIVAESSRAKIFAAERRKSALEELEDFSHPESRLHTTAITSDLPGRAFDRGGQGRHAMEEPSDPKAHEAASFASSLAERLEGARREGAFQELVLVAPPKFLGLLRERLGDPLRAVVTKEIGKNLVRADAQSIRRQILELD